MSNRDSNVRPMCGNPAHSNPADLSRLWYMGAWDQADGGTA